MIVSIFLREPQYRLLEIHGSLKEAVEMAVLD